MRSILLCRFGVATLAAAGALSVPAFAAVDHSSLEGGPEAIYITGEIDAGDDDSFLALADRYPEAVVFLESPGGSLMPAIEIGKTIRQRNYATVVLDEGTCTSSCALIWLAGSPRYLGATGHLGFHAGYTEESGRLVETGVGNAVIGHYLSQLQLSEKAVIFATSASPYNINWLNANNSAEADIGFDPAPPSLPRPAETFLALSAPLEKAKTGAAAVSKSDGVTADEPAKASPARRTEDAPMLSKGATN